MSPAHTRAPGTNATREHVLAQRLTLIRRKEEEERTKAAAARYGMPYIDLRIQPIDREALGLVQYDEAMRANAAVVRRVGKTLSMVMTNPDAPETKRLTTELKAQGYRLQEFLVSPSGFARALETYHELPPEEHKAITGSVEVAESRVGAFSDRVHTFEDFTTHIQDIVGKDTSAVLEFVMAGCLRLDASDLHLERGERESVLRLRINGLLYEAARVPLPAAIALVNRIKLLSQLKLNITKKPQDGRFSFRFSGTDIEVRTSVIPGEYGEDVVLRILNPKTIALTIEDLGIREDLYRTILESIKKPQGMIITTGPTGSGKTTTLYAFVRKVSAPEVKIITVEDPVEYHLEGVAQTQVSPGRGYTFAAALRSVLRQDPDIILVGEIRDLETASTAFQAAQTGHLVFTTLHTNDAPGVIPRLVDLGVKPATIAPTLTLTLAQRLLRKLCESCKTTYSASADEQAMIAHALAGVDEALLAQRIGPSLTLYKAVGCTKCLEGYKGRIGIYEGFSNDGALERLMLESPAPSTLKDALRSRGMITLQQDALLKVLDGITTLDEVARVVG